MNTYKFIKLQTNKKLQTKPSGKEGTSWHLVVDNDSILEDFYNRIERPDNINAVRNYICSDATGLSKWHISHDKAKLLAKHFRSLAMRTDKNMLLTSADAFEFFDKILLYGKQRALKEFGKIYINHFSGYFPEIPSDVHIVDTIIKDKMAFPIDIDMRVRIIIWRGGTHCYAKIGNIDVIMDGKQKWDTFDEAKKAGEKYKTQIIQHNK